MSTVIFLYSLIKLSCMPNNIAKFGKINITADSINKDKIGLNKPLFAINSNIFSSIRYTRRSIHHALLTSSI